MSTIKSRDKNVFCTLFDTNYLGRGSLLADSLIDVTEKNLHLYILAMDDTCYRTLSQMYTNFVTVISLAEFENDGLREAKKNRPFGEFCWACTASLIEYIFDHYNEKFCTYVDADMYFYQSPELLIDEMIDADKSVQLIEHGFKNDFWGKINLRESGRFCVEFNTFKNVPEARGVLRIWVEQTIADTSMDVLNGHLGDQQYLSDWPDKYSFVNVLKNRGAGVAPWNINRYSLVDDELMIDGEKVPLVFYHFHSLIDVCDNTYNIGVYKRYWHIDKKLVDDIYMRYLVRLQKRKNMLKEVYMINNQMHIHPAFSQHKKDGRQVVKKLISPNGVMWGRRYLSVYVKKLLYQRKDIICIDTSNY